MAIPSLLGVLLLCMVSFDAQGGSRSRTAPDATIVYDFDFSITDQGFGLEDPDAVWAWGEPASDAPSGTGLVWSTVPTGTYPFDVDARLISPPMDLAAYSDVTLILEHAYETQLGDASACAAGLETTGDDSACGDGGQLRLRSEDGAEEALIPELGYSVTVAMDSEATLAFGGSSSQNRTYFDLQDSRQDAVRVVARFVSNDTQNDLGWYLSAIRVYEGDIIPPEIEVPDPLSDTPDVEGPYLVLAEAHDNRAISSLTLTYELENGEGPSSTPMILGEDDTWQGNIPGVGTSVNVAYEGIEVRYQITAEDINGNQNTWPSNGAFAAFQVRLPPPYDLQFAWNDPPREASTLPLNWTSPDWGDFDVIAYPLVRYQVLHTVWDAEGVEVVSLEPLTDLDGGDPTIPEATVIATGLPNTDIYVVCAVYQIPDGEGGVAEVCGDYSKSVTIQVAVPRVLSIAPDFAYQDSSIEVTIVGSYTTFVQGEVTLDFGEGIETTAIQVRDISLVSADLRIAPDSPLGGHTVVIGWEAGAKQIVLDSGMTVKGAEDRPRILSISPDRIRQRDQKTIKFLGVNTDFSVEAVAVDFGTGISVGTPRVVSSTELEVDIEVAVWALEGTRDITILSGDESFVVSFLVELLPSSGDSCTCASGPVQPTPWFPLTMILGGIFLLMRRGRAPRSWLRGTYDSQWMDIHTRHMYPSDRTLADQRGLGDRCSRRQQ